MEELQHPTSSATQVSHRASPSSQIESFTCSQFTTDHARIHNTELGHRSEGSAHGPMCQTGYWSKKGKGPVLDIALLHDEHMLSSALQSWMWRLIGMS